MDTYSLIGFIFSLNAITLGLTAYNKIKKLEERIKVLESKLNEKESSDTEE